MTRTKNRIAIVGAGIFGATTALTLQQRGWQATLLAGAPVVERRVCLYCDSFDGDFLIDKDPEHPGLVVASGGSGHGFKFAPVLGDLVADTVEGRVNRWAHRFRWRDAGETRTQQARFEG